MTVLTGVQLRPVRFSDDVAAAAAFFELVGLAPRILSDNGGWAELRAEHGTVAVHPAATSAVGAPAGQTVLSFECPDADALTEALAAGGYAGVEIVDESYGRVVSVFDPDGAHIVAEETLRDTYGYRDHSGEVAPTAGTRVTAVRPSRDPAAMVTFLETLGLTDNDVLVTPAAPGAEVPLLLAPDGTRHPAATAMLVVETAEALNSVAVRLRTGGHPVDLEGRRLRVIDPDRKIVVVVPAR